MSARGVIGVRAVHAIYQAWRIRELLRGIPNPRVVEIGGGLGRTAFYFLLLGVEDYTIIDLPLTAVAQGYFLMQTLGSENVSLHGESEAPEFKVKLLQPSAFFEDADAVDLVVNVDSMTEVDRETADRYWRQIKRRSTKFLSINHEGNPFTVKEIAEADNVGVASSQRYPYALRKGYVEELFLLFRELRQSELLRQADALQLAGRALGDFGEEEDLARHLERREAFGAGKRRISCSVALTPSRRTTAAATSSPSIVVRHRERDDLQHGRVVHQHFVDLARRDLLAAAIDDLLQAAGERDVAVGVDDALVAGAEPAVDERFARWPSDCSRSRR